MLEPNYTVLFRHGEMLDEKEQIKPKTKKVHKWNHGTIMPRKGWKIISVRESDYDKFQTKSMQLKTSLSGVNTFQFPFCAFNFFFYQRSYFQCLKI